MKKTACQAILLVLCLFLLTSCRREKLPIETPTVPSDTVTVSEVTTASETVTSKTTVTPPVTQTTETTTVSETKAPETTQTDPTTAKTSQTTVSYTDTEATTEKETVKTTEADEIKPAVRPYFNIGSCKNLEGRVTVVMFFVDDDTSSWTESDIKSFTDGAVIPGIDFLKAQAKEYGVNLGFKAVRFCEYISGHKLRYEGVIHENYPLAGTAGTNGEVLDSVALDMGYSSVEEMNEAFCEKYEDDQIVYMSFVNKDGLSYTQLQAEPGDYGFMENSLIYRNYSDSKFTLETQQAAIVAHEMLHLFGAIDYYTDDKRAELAKEHMPGDIMLSPYTDISYNHISEMTAYLIGWQDVSPKIASLDDWWE